MLVSYSHGFYYLKAAKVGGTTIECVLGQLCQGEDDIYTKFRLTEDIDSQFRKGSIVKKYVDPEIFTEHTTYSELSKKLNIDGLRPIVSIRHPYEICASECFWNDQGTNEYNQNGEVSWKDDDYLRMKFDQRWSEYKSKTHKFLQDKFEKLCKENMLKRYKLYQFYGDALNDKNLFTIRFSNLEEDLTNLCKQYNINPDIPHTKKTRSLTAEQVSNILRKDQLELIHDFFSEDFRYWGWWKINTAY
jgi:hypothetical protein